MRRSLTAGRRAQSVRGLLTAGRFACPAGFGARDLCAGRPPPDASLARPAIRGFPAAIAAGRGQAAAAPLSAPHKGRVERPLPLCYPHLCLARSYQAHAGAFCGKPLSCACPGDWVHGIGAARPYPMKRGDCRASESHAQASDAAMTRARVTRARGAAG